MAVKMRLCGNTKKSFQINHILHFALSIMAVPLSKDRRHNAQTFQEARFPDLLRDRIKVKPGSTNTLYWVCLPYDA